MSDTRLALVLGGAACVWDDARALLALAAPDAIFAINDMIPRWPGRVDYAVTLHPDKLGDWLALRRDNGFGPPGEVWAHRRAEHVTKFTNDWAGSSGLFSIKIAIGEGFGGVVVAGVPMDSSEHFVRGKPWGSARAFQKGWIKNMAAIKPVARGMSGWPREQLGPPTPEWLASINAAPPDESLIARVRSYVEAAQ